jgi:chromosome segregation ATPase
MYQLKAIKALFCFISVCTVFLTSCASTKKYTTVADTVDLNKEYASLRTDLADLNSNLLKAQSKTSDYLAKAADQTSDALQAAKASKEQAARASDGNLKAVRKAARKAKKADRIARRAYNAREDRRDNEKDIKKLSAKIDKKQKRIVDLEQMRQAILGHKPALPVRP